MKGRPWASDATCIANRSMPTELTPRVRQSPPKGELGSVVWKRGAECTSISLSTHASGLPLLNIEAWNVPLQTQPPWFERASKPSTKLPPHWAGAPPGSAAQASAESTREIDRLPMEHSAGSPGRGTEPSGPRADPTP